MIKHRSECSMAGREISADHFCDCAYSPVFVCEVPPQLGRVTKLEMLSGKVVARTESGMTMIIPYPKDAEA